VVLTVGLGSGSPSCCNDRSAAGVLLAIVILPWALPGVVEGVIWSWIYSPTFGVLNSGLKSLHLIGQYQLFIGSHQIETILFDLSRSGLADHTLGDVARLSLDAIHTR